MARCWVLVMLAKGACRFIENSRIRNISVRASGASAYASLGDKFANETVADDRAFDHVLGTNAAPKTRVVICMLGSANASWGTDAS